MLQLSLNIEYLICTWRNTLRVSVLKFYCISFFESLKSQKIVETYTDKCRV